MPIAPRSKHRRRSTQPKTPPADKTRRGNARSARFAAEWSTRPIDSRVHQADSRRVEAPQKGETSHLRDRISFPKAHHTSHRDIDHAEKPKQRLAAGNSQNDPM
ncbi:hypothetical protein diail_1919 [Diaporthe ilicicola]|nr:hypothetical protein diail_1919 [Diaporthe ilicicola]